MALTYHKTIKLDPETNARLAHLAGARQRTSHWLILQAVREYVERLGKTAFVPGTTIRRPGCTRQWQRPTPGLPNWKLAKTSSRLNATVNLVAAGAA